jgi:outer membrane cobalamin receptor
LKKFFFLFLLLKFFIGNPAHGEKPDLNEVSGSLQKGIVSDTIRKTSEERFIEDDEFKNEVLNYFSIGNDILFEEIDDSFVRSLGDILRMRDFLNVIKVGPPGQLETVSWGGNGNFRIFTDGILYEQQSLHLPQRGVLDLNSIPVENIEKIEILPSGIANLWGRGSGLGGINITTKDYNGIEPYSRITVDRGPDKYRRTQVELGRGMTSRGKIYLTGGFKKSNGYLINSDYDGMSLSGKTTFSLKNNLNLRLFAYQYKSKMGLPLFPDLNTKDTRKKEDNWGIVTTTKFQQKENSFLKVNLLYDKKRQELKSAFSGFDIKKIDELYGLRTTQIWNWRTIHTFQVEGYGEIKKLKAIKQHYVGSAGYISLTDLIRINKKSHLLLFSKIEKEDDFKLRISSLGGFAYQVSHDVNLFTTFGRLIGYPSYMDLLWDYTSLNLLKEDGFIDYVEEGNSNLRPQKFTLTDFGVSLRKKNIKIGGYAFAHKISDFILWSDIVPTPYGWWKPINTEAEIWGINFNYALHFLNHFKTHLSYSFKESKDSNRKLFLPHSPKHSLFGYIQCEDEFLKREIGLKLRLETNILSERFLDEYEKDKEPQVAILNGKITIRFLDFHFYYVVENVTDRAYRLTQDYPMPERSWWWGFYWKFFD